ncbi:MAG: HEPN domain-containing protein [Candidatus Omnitrophica bacterium]|nr:HEPN domain-containing protein [Candidatus Omnitrophota bacterium]
MNWKTYLSRGLIKEQRPNFMQIKRQIKRAQKDLRTVSLVVNDDPEWASTIAYQAMLRSGRALLYAHGYLPADGQQHKTVVEITGIILGKEYELLVKHFERMRKKRNIFFYESEDANNLTEAHKAAEAAKELVDLLKRKIIMLDPQRLLKL